MSDQRVCPFYGEQPMDCCEMGHGYISPYQVEITVRYCISRHQECPRCQALLRATRGERAVSWAAIPMVNPY